MVAVCPVEDVLCLEIVAHQSRGIERIVAEHLVSGRLHPRQTGGNRVANIDALDTDSLRDVVSGIRLDQLHVHPREPEAEFI